MSIFDSATVSSFCIEGQFIDFVIKDGYKLKGLYVETADGEFYIKLAKHLRVAFDWRLPRGTWLKVVGERTLDSKSGKVKLKAERVMASGVNREADRWGESRSEIVSQPAIHSASTKAQAKPATILMCQKSDCMKRGGKALCQALQSELSDRGLQDQVTIKGTGCMKHCKAGPNIVMPDKTRYSRISADQAAAILDRHLTNTPQPAQPAAASVVNINEHDHRVAV